MTDAHCHIASGDPSVRELLIGRDFFGVHPWGIVAGIAADAEMLPALREALVNNPKAGVGEIGLDRLKDRDISPRMREVFESQLALALELGRPVVLHGAKCWGQVVDTVKHHLLTLQTSNFKPQTSQPFLFHGFSRSDGLLPDIVRLGGYISVGPAILNDHAVNYRAMVKKIPRERLLIETDRDEPGGPSIADVAAKLAEVLGMSFAELEKLTDFNAEAFLR